MKTRMNILTLACALTCFSCIGTAHTIQPSKNYQTEKRSLGDIREVSTLSSIDVVYHQTSGSPYAEIYASDNVMPYVVLKESKGELRVYYQDGTSIQGENRCRVDVYAPSVSRFTTMASGDLSADNLKAVKVDAAVYGSGDLSCRASRSITARTYGSGSINYAGNPSQVVTEGKHIYKK